MLSNAAESMMPERAGQGRAFGVVESVLALALAAAVAVVFLVDRRPSATPAAALEPVAEVPAEQPAPARRFTIAVAPERAEFDDVGKLLDGLGRGYAYRHITLDELLAPERLGQFDIVFVTCSGYSDTWLATKSDETLRGGSVYAPNEETFDRAKQSLRKFVEDGGTLYASDLHLPLVVRCFPEFRDRSLDARGAPQTVTASVVDPALRQMIGGTIDLKFDQPDWRPAALSGQGLQVFLEGTFATSDGKRTSAPLLVRFAHGKGTVIFTSFHNEKQNSEQEKKLLQFLVFSVVTAATDADAERQMAKGGFSRTRKNLFSASADAEVVEQSYENAEPADLQFILAFANQGAILELAVTAPDGTIRRERGSATLTIEIPGAAAGRWRYAIRAIKVPSEHFPFTISVGRKH